MSMDKEPTPPGAFVNTSGGKEILVTDERQAAQVVAEVLEHRRRGLGKLIGLAGMPRHGKTEFAKQVRDNRKFGQEEILDYKSGKTYGGRVNIYFLPGEQRNDILIDLAGEDFVDFGRYSSGIPLVMQRILWPILPHLDGLIFFAALPYLWAEWNKMDANGRAVEPEPREIRITEDLTTEMINSSTLLLKYALVAKDLARVRKAHPTLALVKPENHQGPWAPGRHAIDEAFQTAGQLDIPVFLAFSKADLCRTPAHLEGLRTPPLPANGKVRYHARILPEQADPMVLGMQAFPRMHEFLAKHVRYFKYDFVQVIRDITGNPNALEAPQIGQGGVTELCGAESALEFVADHGWGIGSGGTVRALEWARRTEPDRWSREGTRTALGSTWDAPFSTTVVLDEPEPLPPAVEPQAETTTPVVPVWEPIRQEPPPPPEWVKPVDLPPLSDFDPWGNSPGRDAANRDVEDDLDDTDEGRSEGK